MNYIDRAFEQETPSLEVRGRHGRHRGEWSEERIKILRGLIAEGLSGGTMAARMGLSRNAVIGKATRLGLMIGGGRKIARPRAERLAKKRVEMAARRAKPDSKRRGFWESANPKAREWTPPADSVALMELPPDHSDCAVPFMAIGHNQCRYPVNAVGQTFMFCAATSWGDGESYCYRHQVLTHKPSAPKRPWREGRRAA